MLIYMTICIVEIMLLVATLDRVSYFATLNSAHMKPFEHSIFMLLCEGYILKRKSTDVHH